MGDAAGRLQGIHPGSRPSSAGTSAYPWVSLSTAPSAALLRRLRQPRAVCCKATGVYGRHSALRDAVADLLRDCGCENHAELSLPGTQLRPIDIFTPAFPGESAKAIDVSVVHPFSLSFSPLFCVPLCFWTTNNIASYCKIVGGVKR